MATSRKITCKECGHKGVVEAHDTKDEPSNEIFKLLGKDEKGYIHLKCPACKTEVGYSPSALVNPIAKLIFYAIVAFVIWGIIKWLSK